MAIKIYWGDVLRKLRLAHKLSQEDLAGVLHISRQTYSNIECGRSQPTAEELAILSEIYERDLYQYVIQHLPEDMVEEQRRFKITMPIPKKKGKREEDIKYF